MARRSFRGLAVMALLLAAGSGCSKLGGLLGGDEQEPAAAAPSASAPSPVASVAAESDASVCTVQGEKVWGKGANRRTGITWTELDGRIALGVALGNYPYVLSFDAQGNGSLKKLAVPNGSPLATDLPRSSGRRDLQRVTPAVANDGSLTAYADYRDKHENGKRRIACGPAESRGTLLVFDGEPLLEREKKAAEEAKRKAEEDEKAQAAKRAEEAKKAEAAKQAEAAKSAEPAPSARGPAGLKPTLILPPALRKLEPKQPAADAAPVPAEVEAKPAAQPEAEPEAKPSEEKPVREVRDCRSMVDPGGKRVWAVGSELYGKPQSDGTKQWSMRFFVEPSGGKGRVLLKTTALGKDPKALHTLEAPTAQRLKDGAYLLMGRYRGSLFGWTLSSAMRPRGGLRAYGNGYPTLPRFFLDALDYVLLTSQKGEQSYQISFARIPVGNPQLPAKLSRPAVAGVDPSMAEPTLARPNAGQRWLGYQAGDRRESKLVLVPVDAQLGSMGRSFTLTQAGESAYESHLFGLDDGTLLVVYIRNTQQGSELVSKRLSCQVKG